MWSIAIETSFVDTHWFKCGSKDQDPAGEGGGEGGEVEFHFFLTVLYKLHKRLRTSLNI